MAENFDLIFGQNASQQYAWSDNDYQNGWETIGNIPPTAAQFDALQRRSDTKMKELNDELTPLVNADTADSRQPSTTYSVDDIKYSSLLPTGWFLTCTTAGTTSASEIVLPTPIAEGETVTDGTVTWIIRKIGATDLSSCANTDLSNLSATGEAKIQSLAPSYLTDSYYDSTTGDWYRVYSDGWVEQGGIISGDASNIPVTLLKAMADANYNVTLTTTMNVAFAGSGSAGVVACNSIGGGINRQTTTGFYVNQINSESSTDGYGPKVWSVIGMGASA